MIVTRPLTRRNFLALLSAASVDTARLSPAALAQAPGTATLSIGSGTGPKVPKDFVGLSYENMQLEDPTFFSAANKSLVEQFRKIAPTGVLRLGGNTSEFGWWKAKKTDVAPVRQDSPWKATGEPVAATMFAITPEAIDNLRDFLDATGWRCIYGLNLGYGTPVVDVPEATYVYNQLGARLAYFQIGNEVDLFKGHLRDPNTWGVQEYLKQWLAIADAVQKALPDARFGLPDVAGDVGWLPQIADNWPGITQKPHVVSMSHHYYWSGPPSNPAANIDNLLKPDPKVARDAETARQAAERLGPGVTWRMTEGNTVYRGGKSGVSDVFAAALWSANYLLQLMSLGYAGVNLHGGSGHAQAVSVGGVFHGEALMANPNAPHPKPFYTPIANEGTLAGSGVDGKLNGTYLLEPVGYGMKFAAAFAGASMLPVKFYPGPVNATAYAAKQQDGRVLVAVLNKDASLELVLPFHRGDILEVLSAPSLDSHEVSLVTPTGNFAAGVRLSAGMLHVPAHTGVLLHTS